MSESHIPEGRKIAEAMLQAANTLDTHPVELHDKNDPYYWEPEYPDEEVDHLSLFTILGHNLHYMYMTTYNFMANVGYRIIDFLGWSGSDYDWIETELRRDKEEEELQAREQLEEKQFIEAKKAAKLNRQRDAVEKGVN